MDITGLEYAIKFKTKCYEKLSNLHTYLLRKNFLSPQGTELPNWLYIIAQKFGNAWNHNPFDNPRCPKCGALPLKTKGNILGWFFVQDYLETSKKLAP